MRLLPKIYKKYFTFVVSILIISCFSFALFVLAGTDLVNTSEPAITMHSLDDIYALIDGTPTSTPTLYPNVGPDSPSMHSISELYIKLANLIHAEDLASSSVTYLGVTGGTSTPANLDPITKEFDPTSTPGTITGFTLDDIYNLVTNTTDGTSRLATTSHESFEPTSSPTIGTMHTLGDIYDELYTLIDPANIATGTVYLGRVGNYSAEFLGGVITTDGLYTIHTFNTSDTFVVPNNKLVDILVVAGGGAGGPPFSSNNYGGGGGGGGGVIATSNLLLAKGSYPVIVGAGGESISSDLYSDSGDNSVFGELTAIGGGAGGYMDGLGTGNQAALLIGRDGGSGGGSAAFTPSGPNGGVGQPEQGNNGGKGSGSVGVFYAGGGGGGAHGSGSNAVSETKYGGAGGPGILSSISGTPTYYGGGGGGGSSASDASGGGASDCGGVGGAGDSPIGKGGNNNTGCGGGGGGYTAAGGAGGSGIVIIRYLTN